MFFYKDNFHFFTIETLKNPLKSVGSLIPIIADR